MKTIQKLKNIKIELNNKFLKVWKHLNNLIIAILLLYIGTTIPHVKQWYVLVNTGIHFVAIIFIIAFVTKIFHEFHN